jgi:hypothetical protein
VLSYHKPAGQRGLLYETYSFKFKDFPHYGGKVKIILQTSPSCASFNNESDKANTTLVAIQANSTTIPFPSPKKVECEEVYVYRDTPDIWQFINIDFDHIFTSSSTYDKPIINPNAITFK